ETIAVLLVFFIILMFIFIFYISIRSSSLEEKQKDFYSQQATQVALEVVNMPELECSGAGIELGVDCFDKLKIKALSDLMQKSVELRAGLYQEKFGNSKIVLREIYNLGNFDEINYTIYDREPDNKQDEYFFQTLVSIHDPTINAPIGIRGIGQLEITFYSTK
ncbi:hypothetical protein KY312_00170, partial [Candidatus Woesearchaeota archaeon]|nr:hypothetical protein [Candidatus Woesearchaeota archaeon]